MTAQAQIRAQRGRRRSSPRPNPLLLRQPTTPAALTAPVERPAPRPAVNAEPGAAEPSRRRRRWRPGVGPCGARRG
ncbi:hypothetical protein B9W61_00795 [Streptomyces sp. CS057]|nr:hypothetical protein B9W61_00795 [Streptomyces sp. CS057]